MRAGSTSDRTSISFWIFIAAGIAGVLLLNFPGFDFSGGTEMFAEARSLAVYGIFANPYDIANTGFTAANPPVYPLVLAILMKLLPASVAALVAVLGNILANAVAAACLPGLSVLFFEDEITGAVGAVLWLAAMQLTPVWDTSYSVAGLGVFCLVTARLMERHGFKLQFGVCAGVACGLPGLLNFSSLMVSVPWIAYVIAREKVTPTQALRFGTVFLAGLLLFPYGHCGICGDLACLF